MRIAAALALVAALWSASAAAQQAPISEADRAAIRSIIEGQEEAFRRDDGATAFGYASPAIREMFSTPDVFMDMVRQGYPMVYRPRLFDFAEIVMKDGRPTQKVRVIGPDGRHHTAFYPMTRLPDGTWRIDGCYLESAEEHQA
jgi:Domain of unknown function (DUF4864)